MNQNARAPIRSVAVFGGGLVALAAAIAFARALPGATVTLVRTASDPAAFADRFPTLWPATTAMLDTLGLSEERLVLHGAATHGLGSCFTDWGGNFAVTHGEGIPQIAGAALHQLWLAHDGKAYNSLNPASALLETDRFIHPNGNPADLLSRIDYAIRLDSCRALPIFTEEARRAGIRIFDGDIADLETRDHGLASIRLQDGRSIAADFFIDATGCAAALSAGKVVDWRASLPADHMLLWEQAARPAPSDRYRAIGIGWRASWSFADRRMEALAYAASITTDQHAGRLAGDVSRNAEVIAINYGRRVTPLAGNVLSLGDAACATGPFGDMGFTLAMADLALVLDLMPALDPDPLLAAEYNRRATQRHDHARDFLSALHLVPVRKGVFWDARHNLERPDTLVAKLIQFEQRGRLPARDDDLVSNAMWIQALLGMGGRPRRLDPVALSVAPDAARSALTRLRTAVADLPRRVPPYADYLAHIRIMKR